MTLADRVAPGSIERAHKARVDITPTGGEFADVVVDQKIDNDWTRVFEIFGLDAAEFEVVEDTVRMSTWQQSARAKTGDRDLVQLWSYAARFKRKPKARLSDADIEQHRADVRRWRMPARPARTRATVAAETPSAAVINLADVQGGKSEGGGVAATSQRLLDGLANVQRYLDRVRREHNVTEVVLVNNGDPLENCAGNYCVSADTPVLTDDLRWVPAGTLQEGDGLYSLSEEPVGPRGRRFEKAAVTRHHVEDADVVEVLFKNGETLVCTPEHPLLTRASRTTKGSVASAKWTPASKIKPGAQVAKMFDVWEQDQTFDAGWLSGLYDGEGCLSGGRGESGPNVLAVSQKPGLVLKRAARLLRERGFDFGAQLNKRTGVVTLRARGGYAETLRLLGTIRPERLIAKLGEPMAHAKHWVDVVSVTPVGRRPIARMSTSSRTYFAAGYASHNSAQLFTVELNLRGQMNFVLDHWELYAKQLFPQFERAQFVSVLCNHGELGRMGGAKSQTSDSDNAGGFLAETLRRVLDRPEFGHVEWTIPHDQMNVYPTIAGVPTGFNHGHKIPGNDASGFEKWLNGQVRGDLAAHAARVWVTAHRHHFAAWDMGSCTVFQCPSMDGGSKWLRDITGRFSRSGIVAMLVGEHDRMGWSDLAFL